MERFAMDKLVEWKNSKNRKPLILWGARQVGKTWLMNEFGKRYFTNVVSLNFDEDVKLGNIFDEDYDVKRIIKTLEILAHQSIEPEKTLIIFDEVQSAPRVISSLKYFNENASEYHIIAAGSLLGVTIHEGVSFPVGKVNSLYLHPMNFQEFLMAIGEEGLVELLKKRNWDIIKTIKDRYIQRLKEYYVVGGMPAVVDTYVATNDIFAVRDIQKELIDNYERDFSKHVFGAMIHKVNLVWNSVPNTLAKENKKFAPGDLKPGSRTKDYETSIQWLVDSGLVHKVPQVSKPGIPITYYETKVFKLYTLDIGLLGAKANLDVKSIVEGNEVLVEFKGAYTEQFVLQELISKEKSLYYWSSNGKAEVDFIYQFENNVLPIEVKAEVNLKAQSLKVYNEKYHPLVSVRTSLADYKKEDWLLNVPLYGIYMLDEILEDVRDK
ncbi:MAG: AAA family ATPase [Lachnospiraceae bacterium]|jgi:predicted AAA+ superfamily ATPase|nr:AAA family ATPase [Lachnospiraceae bacterium]